MAMTTSHPHPRRRRRPGGHTIFRRRGHDLLFIAVRRRPRTTASAVPASVQKNFSKNPFVRAEESKIPRGVLSRADRAAVAATPAAARGSVAGAEILFSLSALADVPRLDPTFHLSSVRICPATDCREPKTALLKILKIWGVKAFESFQTFENFEN